MEFPHGSTVYRLRAAGVMDEYSEQETSADWANPSILPIPGAFIGPTSTSMLATATREQATEARSLFCEGGVDVIKGDRIRDGVEGAPIYSIDGIPPDAVSVPWTGWTPPREIPLSRWVG